jgi:hypothetical protein
MTYDGSRVVSLALRDELEPLSVVLAWMRGARLTRRAQAFSAACRSTGARAGLVGAAPSRRLAALSERPGRPR